MSVGEKNTTPSEPIEIWRLDIERLTLELTRPPIIEIVNGNEEDVWVGCTV